MPKKKRLADLKPDEPHEQETRKIGGWEWVVVVLAIYSLQFTLDQTLVANVQVLLPEACFEIEKSE
jgi:hypothetical protein